MQNYMYKKKIYMCMHEHVAARNAMQIIVTSKTSDSSDLHVRTNAYSKYTPADPFV